MSSKRLQVQCCFTSNVNRDRTDSSTETITTIRDWEPRTATSTFKQLHTGSVLLYVHRDHMATSTFTQLMSSKIFVLVQCCFTSTETTWTITDGEPRMATTTFTQLLSSEIFLHVQCCFTSTESTRTLEGSPGLAFTQLLSSDETSCVKTPLCIHTSLCVCVCVLGGLG